MDMTGPQNHGSWVAVHSDGRQMDGITVMSGNVRMVTRGPDLYRMIFLSSIIFIYLYTNMALEPMTSTSRAPCSST